MDPVGLKKRGLQSSRIHLPEILKGRYTVGSSMINSFGHRQSHNSLVCTAPQLRLHTSWRSNGLMPSGSQSGGLKQAWRTEEAKIRRWLRWKFPYKWYSLELASFSKCYLIDLKCAFVRFLDYLIPNSILRPFSATTISLIITNLQASCTTYILSLIFPDD